MAKSPDTIHKPRCNSCRWWLKANDAGNFGVCHEPTSPVFMDEAMHMHVEKLRLTTDLTVCSLWASRD